MHVLNMMTQNVIFSFEICTFIKRHFYAKSFLLPKSGIVVKFFIISFWGSNFLIFFIRIPVAFKLTFSYIRSCVVKLECLFYEITESRKLNALINIDIY